MAVLEGILRIPTFWTHSNAFACKHKDTGCCLPAAGWGLSDEAELILMTCFTLLKRLTLSESDTLEQGGMYKGENGRCSFNLRELLKIKGMSSLTRFFFLLFSWFYWLKSAADLTSNSEELHGSSSKDFTLLIWAMFLWRPEQLWHTNTPRV